MDTGVVAKKKKQKKKVAAGESGPFENFLKVEEEDEEEDGRDPAVFSTFLKSSGKGGVGAAKVAAQPAVPKVVERPSPSMAKVGGWGAASHFSHASCVHTGRETVNILCRIRAHTKSHSHSPPSLGTGGVWH